MRVDVYFTSAEVEAATLGKATAVVIDAVRATTTIVEALANGAVGVYPTASAEDAAKLALRWVRRIRCCAASAGV